MLLKKTAKFKASIFSGSLAGAGEKKVPGAGAGQKGTGSATLTTPLCMTVDLRSDPLPGHPGQGPDIHYPERRPGQGQGSPLESQPGNIM